jgi:tRNA U54 and U55 pseudouridine synthase Pus10
MMPHVLLEDFPVFKADPDFESKDVVSHLRVECSCENILVYGRYIKLSRELSQTPWSVDGGAKKTASSV